MLSSLLHDPIGLWLTEYESRSAWRVMMGSQVTDSVSLVLTTTLLLMLEASYHRVPRLKCCLGLWLLLLLCESLWMRSRLTWPSEVEPFFIEVGSFKYWSTASKQSLLVQIDTSSILLLAQDIVFTIVRPNHLAFVRLPSVHAAPTRPPQRPYGPIALGIARGQVRPSRFSQIPQAAAPQAREARQHPHAKALRHNGAFAGGRQRQSSIPVHQEAQPVKLLKRKNRAE